jgi:hypothetical protein
MARDAEINPFKDTIVFRKLVEFLGTIPINLKGNKWDTDKNHENPINWNKPPKGGDGVWHAQVKLIDPDGEEFEKTFFTKPTTRKLSKKENPNDIIDLDRFYDP